jgi:hypothetical protein
MDGTEPRLIQGHPPKDAAVLRGAIREAKRVDMIWRAVQCRRCECMEAVIIGGGRILEGPKATLDEVAAALGEVGRILSRNEMLSGDWPREDWDRVMDLTMRVGRP